MDTIDFNKYDIDIFLSHFTVIANMDVEETRISHTAKNRNCAVSLVRKWVGHIFLKGI